MGTRGLWNLRVNGKWYRKCHPRGLTSSPDNEATFRKVELLQAMVNVSQEWDPVPFPSPLHTNLDYVYTVDLDAKHLTIALWEGHDRQSLQPGSFRVYLADIHKPSDLIPAALGGNAFKLSVGNPRTVKKAERPTYSSNYHNTTLNIDIGDPSRLSELQHRLFTDFIFQWRYYIDDHTIWQYPSTLFNMFSIAILRLAAWDLEVSSDSQVELPISFKSIPRWKSPDTNEFWFHGFFIVLCESLDTSVSIDAGISRAKQHLNKNMKSHSILVSLRHVVFAEFKCNNIVLCSLPVSLILNNSAMECSPGFRLLTYTLCSPCWKSSFVAKEDWGASFPPEVLEMILLQSKSKDILSFCQASFLVKGLYHRYSLPQFDNFKIRSFHTSIPCCGIRYGIEANGVYCTQCYAWRHAACVGVENIPPNRQHLCLICRENTFSPTLDPGGVTKASRRKDRGVGCSVDISGSPRLFQLRVSPPSYRRPELRFLGDHVSVPPLLIDYTIRFSGEFSGLAYGLELDL